MSEGSSKQVDTRGQINIGVVRTVLATFAIFLLPQILAAIVFSVVATAVGESPEELFDSSSIGLNFGFGLGVAAVGMYMTYLFAKSSGGFKVLGYKLAPFKKMLLFIPAYLAYFVVLIIAFALIDYFNLGVDLDQEQTVGFEEAKSSLQLALAFISLVIVAPVFEETFFRGFAFQGIAAKTGFWPAAISTSALFGLAHFQLNVGIDTFLLGIAACWLVWKTKSIYPAILLHMLKNSVAFVILFVV